MNCKAYTYICVGVFKLLKRKFTVAPILPTITVNLSMYKDLLVGFGFKFGLDKKNSKSNRNK